jgi:hypothetical protein
MALDNMKALVPEFFHQCPYTGVVSGNFSVQRKFVLMYPSGVFKQTLLMTNGTVELMRSTMDFVLD